MFWHQNYLLKLLITYVKITYENRVQKYLKNTSKFKRSTSSTNKPNLEALYFSSHEEFEYLKTSFWRIFPYLKFLQFLDYPGFNPISQPSNLIWYSIIFFSKPQWCPLFSSIVENFSTKSGTFLNFCLAYLTNLVFWKLL